MKNNTHECATEHAYDHANEHANESTHSLEAMQNQGKKQPEENQTTNNSTNYKFAFFLILVFAIIELFGGMFTHSLALLSDAWHMFSDVLHLAWHG